MSLLLPWPSLHERRAFGAEPLALGPRNITPQPHALQMEPFHPAVRVVARDHLPKGHPVAEAVRGLARVC